MISDVALNYDPVVHTAISIHTALPAARDWLARTLLPNATSLHTIEVPILSWGGFLLIAIVSYTPKPYSNC